METFYDNDERSGKDRKIGMLTTIIFHLIVLIIMLCTGIKTTIQQEKAYIFDFSAIEQLENEIKRQQIKDIANKEIEEALDGTPLNRNTVRNVIVDESDRRSGEMLRDDRNANSVYEQARELQKKLEASRMEAKANADEGGEITLVKNKRAEKTAEADTYKGPSVLSYNLDGRKMTYAHMPAYKCLNGGEVTVAITVNRSGHVIKAEIISSSTTDGCIMQEALDAAKRSVFSSSYAADKEQTGEITYSFIRQ